MLATNWSFSVMAQGLPTAGQPAGVGLSTERLKLLSGAFRSEFESGAIPGAVVLIAWEGKVACFSAFRIARSAFQ
jgi:hypothetical protein